MEIVLLACLAAQPSTCREWVMDASPMTALPVSCQIAAATEFVPEFTRNHPKWVVKRTKCQPVKKRELKA